MEPVRNQTLSRFLRSPGRFAVCGRGAPVEAALLALESLGLKPHALVDADRRGTFRGLEILPPEEAIERALDAVVVADPEPRDRTAALRADGFEGPILDLSAWSEPGFAARHDERLLAEAADAIEFARSLVRDDGSRQIFDALLVYCRSLDPGDLPPPTPPGAPPAPPVADGEWIVDVSAAGEAADETALALAEAVGPQGRVYALADADERREGLRTAVATSALGGRIEVYDRTCGKASATGTDEEGGIVTLDDFVWEETCGRVDRIRLDTPEVGRILAGASATLAERRPRLALCLGHGPRDLWELPIRLKEQVPGYRLCLGHHAQSLSGTFCYAQAPARALGRTTSGMPLSG